MRKLYDKIAEMIYRRDYELRERIFRMIILIGSLMAAFGMLECILLMDVKSMVVPLLILLVVMIGEFLILKIQMKLFEIEREAARRQQVELEKASNAKNSFFASMSHEIRTPIHTIIGLNEMILRESGEKETKEYAQNIQSASRMLLNLVNDILDLSQVEMKKMEIIPQQYKTVDLFGNLIDMIQVRLKEKKLELIVDIDETLPSVLNGDMKRISQVVLNILTNAAKYTDTGSVTLSVQEESTKGEDIFLRISVIDTGIGIRKENLEHIFDVFHRVDVGKNQKVEGSGLGLAITKQLVDLMGGNITVDSIYTKGSTFTVILPQKIVDAAPIGAVRFLALSKRELEEYQPSFTAPEARVLIVDDNAMNAMVESRLLAATKIQVDTAGSGAECLEKIKRKYYHVILMDYMMPEMNGSEALKLLRKQENGLCRDSAVIALSANPAAEAEQRLLEEGFNGYLEKPIQGMALETEILKFIPNDIVEYRAKRQTDLEDEEVRKAMYHKRKKVYITTDCISDLSEQLLDKYDIGMIYLYIKTDSGRFVDVLEISADNLNRYMTDSTSSAVADAASVEEYEEFFAGALTHGERVIHISMAKNMGNSYEAALTAARCFDHVRVIDSKQVSGGQALITLYAGKLAMEGFSADEICKNVENMLRRIESRYIMPSAAIFAKHGYMNKVNAKLCGLLGLHPTLKMSRSSLAVSGIRAGRLDGAWRRFIRWHLLRKSRINTDVIYISHVGCSVEQQEQIRREVLRCVPFKKVYMQRTSVSIACNAGIGTFGFAYYVNAKDEALKESVE